LDELPDKLYPRPITDRLSGCPDPVHWLGGYPFTLPRVWISVLFYLAIGCCWLPVVWLQIRMRDLAIDATKTGRALPPDYCCH